MIRCLSLILLLSVWQSDLRARTLHVRQDGKLRSLQAAVSAAASNDSIVVHAGIYTGHTLVDKPLTIVGEGFPVFDGSRQSEILTISAPRVTIRGLKLVRSGRASLNDPAGIKVFNGRFVTITGNQLDDNFFGIYIQHGSRCAVTNNTIVAYGVAEQAIGNGIHCWKSDSLTIASNSIQGHRDGIYFEFVTNSVIRGNYSHGNVRYGLHFMFSNNDAYLNNRFSGNGAGVAVMFTRSVKMYDNIFEENWGDASYGLMLKEISDSHIRGNRFSGNTTAIQMEGTNRIIVEKNVFSSNGWGLKIQASCMDNEVRSNNFTGNTFDVSTNGSLVLNKFSGNYWDKYEGYDLDHNNIGDIPYRPLSLFSVIVENNPPAMLLFRSFIVSLLDKSERILPSLTPDNFIDETPLMRALSL